MDCSRWVQVHLQTETRPPTPPFCCHTRGGGPGPRATTRNSVPGWARTAVADGARPHISSLKCGVIEPAIPPVMQVVRRVGQLRGSCCDVARRVLAGPSIKYPEISVVRGSLSTRRWTHPRHRRAGPASVQADMAWQVRCPGYLWHLSPAAAAAVAVGRRKAKETKPVGWLWLCFPWGARPPWVWFPSVLGRKGPVWGRHSWPYPAPGGSRRPGVVSWRADPRVHQGWFGWWMVRSAVLRRSSYLEFWLFIIGWGCEMEVSLITLSWTDE
jgi:hypothetical protein